MGYVLPILGMTTEMWCYQSFEENSTLESSISDELIIPAVKHKELALRGRGACVSARVLSLHA
jgi:hypothetical protein